MEIWKDIATIEKQLESALKTLRINGTDYAEKEKLYRIAKAKKILELKSNGYPITIIPDLAKGDEEVADLDLQHNIAEVVYKANVEALHVKQQEYSLYKLYYDKEYTNTRG